MSVTIRLAKFGKKFAPSYKVVVANTRDKRNGKFLDILGYYNPSTNPVEFEIDKGKYKDWKNKGALSTKAVEKLIDGSYVFVKYAPNKEEESEKVEESSEEESEPKAAEEPAEESAE